MDKKIKIHWVTPEYEGLANALGYSFHNKMMRQHTAPYIEFDDKADIAMHITPGDKFVPIPGKKNILFSMWEFADVPNNYIRAFDKADVLIVPSTFCKEVFRRHTDKPIMTCYEGVDPNLYKPYPRGLPMGEKRFRFLWIGAPNPRKGYPMILEAVKVLEKTPGVEIYIKTTVPKRSWKQSLKSIWDNRKDILFSGSRQGKMVRRATAATLRRLSQLRPYYEGELRVAGTHKNIFYDTRKLPLTDLISLYNSAHCFLMPTLGEGWGLTLCEAMATGCPSIATPVTGCSEYFDEVVGFPIKYSMYEQDLAANYNLKARGYVPDTKHFIEQMIYVMQNYKEALKRGERASRRIRETYTWERSGKRLSEILREVAG